ncbi:MAG: group II truncated hemoglobin [Bacteroidota bacterium]
MKTIPTLYDWAGGMPVFEKLMQQFYDKVLLDPLLEPVFKHMSSAHRIHVAHFFAEVFGGPEFYSTSEGSHYKMIRHHVGKHLSEGMRKQWIHLLIETADELAVPDDPEFRSAFMAYIEWGTRLALINSNLDEVNASQDEPMPKWGWGVPGGPYIP